MCAARVLTTSFCRHNLDQLLEVMMYDDSSSDQSSSSAEGDMDVLFLALAFAPKRILGAHITLQDIPDGDCELMFRYFGMSQLK